MISKRCFGCILQTITKHSQITSGLCWVDLLVRERLKSVDLVDLILVGCGDNIKPLEPLNFLSEPNWFIIFKAFFWTRGLSIIKITNFHTNRLYLWENVWILSWAPLLKKVFSFKYHPWIGLTKIFDQQKNRGSRAFYELRRYHTSRF